ncbi:MAG TPA: hypothetical protein VFG10_20695 [Saprospiraceae bacterium]|nr:hypothetical protein [Saprospiraceae bacterium]
MKFLFSKLITYKTGLLCILIFCDCKYSNKENLQETQSINIDFKTNWIEARHLIWYCGEDRGDFEGSYEENLSQMILNAFLINNCTDTIIIPVTTFGLCLNTMQVYLNNNQAMGCTFDDIIDSYVRINPNDSFQLNIAEAYSHRLERVDSINLNIGYIIKNTPFKQNLKIYKKDFQFR